MRQRRTSSAGLKFKKEFEVITLEEEHRGVALVILGIIAVIAVIGLVLMFSGARKSAGAVFTNTIIQTSSGLPCDSPCTVFPSGNQYDTRMMGLRVDMQNRGWTFIGTVKIDGTTRTGYISAETPGGWNDPVLECWCPPQGIPQFLPTDEFAAIIPGTGTGAAEDVGRYPGTPVDQYTQVEFPTGVPQQAGQVPSYPYPASLNK